MALGPLPSVPNVLKVVITNQGNDGRVSDNVCHFGWGAAAPGSLDCERIAEGFWQGWVAQFTPTQPAQTSLTRVTVTDLSSPMGGEGYYDDGATPVPGTSAHGMLPFHTCFLLSKFIVPRYRGGRPRSYLPIGTTNDLNDDGDWKESSYTPWVTSWSAMISYVVGNNPYGGTNVGLECNVSYNSKYDPHNSGPPEYRRVTPVVSGIPIDGYTGSAKLATQRRRVRRTERRR